jgi:hypothetical protein
LARVLHTVSRRIASRFTASRLIIRAPAAARSA